MSSADALAAQERVQNAMSELIDEIDKSHLRKIQLKMHQCAAKCCTNETASLEQTHSCIAECSVGVQVAQNYVHKEVGALQERLQRCILDCQDSAKDEMGTNPTEAEVSRLKTQFEACAIRCVDDNLQTLPKLLKRMKAAFDQNLN